MLFSIKAVDGRPGAGTGTGSTLECLQKHVKFRVPEKPNPVECSRNGARGGTSVCKHFAGQMQEDCENCCGNGHGMLTVKAKWSYSICANNNRYMSHKLPDKVEWLLSSMIHYKLHKVRFIFTCGLLEFIRS